jgi:hypothetical protein
MRCILLTCCACLFLSMTAQADTLYTYTYQSLALGQGDINNTYNGHRLQLTLDFTAALNSYNQQVVTPLDWYGNDGINFLASANCPGCVSSFAIATSSSGAIESWTISIKDAPLSLTWRSSFYCDPAHCNDNYFYGDQTDSVQFGSAYGTAVHNSPSVADALWSAQATNVPEPSTLPLMLMLGLPALVAVRRVIC